MSDGEGKNDIAWRALFARHDIAERATREGAYFISAEEIREYREPRLMAKFDHRVSLPAIFRDNGLAILPVSRGRYVISHFNCYMNLEPDFGCIVRMKFPDSIQSIDPASITSEAVAVNCALASGIFADFLGESPLAPTVSGRMGSGVFDFAIRNDRTGRDVAVRVDNAQIEIDAALESPASLFLVEAKRDIASDFIVRQLFYPFKTWERRVAKKVRPIYLVHSNGIFTLREYAATDAGAYNSFRLVKSRRYSLEDTDIDRKDVAEIAAAATIAREPEIPFPQADRFERVINLCELLANEELTRSEVTKRYDFDKRQTNYYADAGRYLGLVEKHAMGGREVGYGLTRAAEEMLTLPYRERQLRICEHILAHGVFNRVLRLLLADGVMPEREAVVREMKDAGLYRVEGESTYRRRASTVMGWVNWIAALWGGGM